MKNGPVRFMPNSIVRFMQNGSVRSFHFCRVMIVLPLQKVLENDMTDFGK